ncbi:MAG: hypothetical protein ACRERC_10770, partial [Candidatus Binatia bacterium]
MKGSENFLLPTVTGRFAAELALLAQRRARGAALVGTPAAFALAVLSGLLYAATFPPLSWSVAAWVALVPLLVACASLPPGRAALAGMGWTAAMGVGAASFLPGMLSSYFGLATGPSWLASLAIGGLYGLYVSAYAAWVAWLVRRRAAHPMLLAGGWLVCEFARAQGLLGPWALAAYSQLPSTVLVQMADLAGPYGIGMLIAAVNAGFAALLVPALRGRRPWRSAALIAAILAGALIYGQWRLGQSFAGGASVQVAVVQGGAATSAEPAARAARLARYVGLTNSGAHAKAGLIVWPEYALETYLDEASSGRDTVLRLAGESRANLILGGPHYARSAAGTR